MADNDQAVNDNDASGGGLLGMIGSVISGAASMVGKAWDAVTGDPALASAGNMGLDELGQALQAFPDSIQASGSINGSLDQADDTGRAMWPSEIAEANRIAPPEASSSGTDYSNGQSYDAGYSM